MVAGAHAVVDPGTVVVKSLYTSVTEGAVAGALCPNDLAVGA